MDAMLERNKRAMRELIRRTVPETKQLLRDYICDDGLHMGPYKIACSMWREGDKCIFDFTGTDPQSISSINFLLNEENVQDVRGRLHDHGVRPRRSCSTTGSTI
jgi:N-methylhydantoinase B